MKKIGLALSGGGFRASLYHLGLVRFLRDAAILPQVTQITSVSGGSIFAAHLVLNWERYNGSPQEFEKVAGELLDFVRLDVRNRIMRRWPLSVSVKTVDTPDLPASRIASCRRNSGLLEYHYEKYLYGDTSMFELREKPQLHILATNLSEGCLCSFNRNGLLMLRRQPGHTFRLDHIHLGLATVPMAVAASSAFPGFFPPLELTSARMSAPEAVRLRPPSLHRRRRVRQPGCTHVRLSGALLAGREPPLPRGLPRFSDGRAGAASGQRGPGGDTAPSARGRPDNARAQVGAVTTFERG